MADVWSASVIAQLHILGITQKDFAGRCGYTPAYLSMILRGHKDTQQAHDKIDDTLKRLKQEKEIYI